MTTEHTVHPDITRSKLQMKLHVGASTFKSLNEFPPSKLDVLLRIEHFNT